MMYLLYCVFESRGDNSQDLPVGVGGKALFSVANNGLNGAVSRIDFSDLTPDISQVVAYAKVVEFFHSAHTVIPMRYGCVFREESHVIESLEERSEEYKALLRELDGCVEMGVRVFLKKAGGDIPGGKPCHLCPVFHLGPRGGALGAGQAYLAARKAHYAQEEQAERDGNDVLERCRAAFEGLFVKCKAETAPFGLPQGGSPFRVPLVSLYFLVRRERVEVFRNAFHRLGSEESAKVLLSGPWPPYNFAESAEAQLNGLRLATRRGL